MSTIVGADAGLCLGVNGFSLKPGAQLQSQTCVASDFQRWKFVRDSAGYYEVVNVGSGQCLDVPNGSSANGLALRQWACNGLDAQKWNFGDQGSGEFAVVSASGGLALGVEFASKAAGARVTQDRWTGSKSQKWAVPTGYPVAAGLPANGAIITLTNSKSSLCLGVADSSTDTGAKLQTQECTAGAPFQQWTVRADAAGDYQIASVGSGACIDVPGAATSKTVLQQWGCSNQPWQKWQFHNDAAGQFHITPKVSDDLALHEAAAGKAGGVDQSRYMAAPSQLWTLTVVGQQPQQRPPATVDIVAPAAKPRPIGFGAGTTGGSAPGNEDVTVATREELTKALCSSYYGALCNDTKPRIIRIKGIIDFTGTEGKDSQPGCINNANSCMPAIGAHGWLLNKQNGCKKQDGTMSPMVSVTFDKAGATNPLMVGSNKTIYGEGANSGIKGKGFRLLQVSNVIFRNLSVSDINDGIVWAGDGIWIDDSHDVVIDHIRTRGLGRQAIVMGAGNSFAQNVTISNNFFDATSPYGYQCDQRAYYTLLLGGRDKTVTLANNRFHNSSGRAPEVGGTGIVHMVNNYYDANSWNGGLDSAKDVAVLLEGNYFSRGTADFRPIADNTPDKSGWYFAPLAGNLTAANSACIAAFGRSCAANVDQGNLNVEQEFLLHPVVMSTIQSMPNAAAVIRSVTPVDPATLPQASYGPRADIQP